MEKVEINRNAKLIKKFLKGVSEEESEFKKEFLIGKAFAGCL